MGELASPTSVRALLAAVEALPPRTAGAFVITDGEGRSLGALLADDNRVCWAGSAGAGRRLRDLLELQPGSPAVHALGEAVSPGALRAALKQHTVESLIRLDGCVGEASFVAHRAGGYRAPCTFATTELFAAVGAALYASEAEAADGLDALRPPGAIGASFVVGDDGEPVVVREHDGDRLGLGGLGELGAWATAALDVTPGFSRAAMLRAIASVAGPAALAWRASRRLVHALVLDDPGALARTVDDLERRHLPAVLSTRVPRAPTADVGMVPTRRAASP